MLLGLANDDSRPAAFVVPANFGPYLAEVNIMTEDETDVADYCVIVRVKDVMAYEHVDGAEEGGAD